jgi:UDP-N-acetylglucosamine 2-epimerase (non-hydrolysing)
MTTLSETAVSPARVGVVLGTRPEGIKLAPVVHALQRSERCVPVIVSTGQHREMLAEVLGVFGLAADVDLDLMGVPGGLTGLAGQAVARIGATIDALDLDALVVQGDTTTAVAGAMAGFYRRIPVAHVEAGLRTHDRFSPYPEEVNRRLVTQLADLHLAPTRRAGDHLLAEGVDPARVLVTGNTVVDALFDTVRRERPYAGHDAALLVAVEAGAEPVLLVTAHRRESWGDGLRRLAEAVAGLVADHPKLVVVFPVHPNPVVRDAVRPVLAGLDRVHLVEPLAYSDFVRLLARADLVLTDSGGIQEEACSLGKPTLVARDTTERPEGQEAGGLLLVGTDPGRIRREAGRLLADPDAYDSLVCTSLPFGDGAAADRIVEALLPLLPAPAGPTHPHPTLDCR